MPTLTGLMTDPNYINANEATKRAIFDKLAPKDPNYVNANPETQAAIRERFGITTPAPSSTPSLPKSLQGSPKADPNYKEPTLWEKARPYVVPTAEAVGAAAGGLIGAGVGTVTTAGVPSPATVYGGIAGAGLGLGMTRELIEQADVHLGRKTPRTLSETVKTPLKNVAEGAAFEMGGRVIGPVASAVAKSKVGAPIGNKLAELPNLSKNRAARIARESLGDDVPTAINKLRAAISTGDDVARATGDINAPTWHALVERSQLRDPKMQVGILARREASSLNNLSRIAGGTTATEVRAARDITKHAVRDITTPMREQALSRADLGKQVTNLESMSAELGEAAAAKVAEVRRLMDLGQRAKAAARLDLIKRDLPVGLTKYHYYGELGDKAMKEWSDKAASASLDLGQGARFAKASADELRANGIAPLKADSLVGNLRKMAAQGVGTGNDEFAGNEIMFSALRNVADDVARWTDGGGIVSAKALDAIRKNSVNSTIAKLLPNADTSTKKKTTAEVLARIRPMVDDAIEQAGGKGYREYLAKHRELSNAVAQRDLAGEALRLWKTNKDEFVRLVQGESPDKVEEILGPKMYNIASELSEGMMSTLRSEAQNAIKDAKIKTQVSKGEEALKELMAQHMQKFSLPSLLNVFVTTANRTLLEIEKRVSKKTLVHLTNAMKTPQGAVDLLETLPTTEREKVIGVINDIVTKRSALKTAAGTGTVAATTSMTQSEETNNNGDSR